jgi:hypothetical protein
VFREQSGKRRQVTETHARRRKQAAQKLRRPHFETGGVCIIKAPLSDHAAGGAFFLLATRSTRLEVNHSASFTGSLRYLLRI